MGASASNPYGEGEGDALHEASIGSAPFKAGASFSVPSAVAGSGASQPQAEARTLSREAMHLQPQPQLKRRRSKLMQCLDRKQAREDARREREAARQEGSMPVSLAQQKCCREGGQYQKLAKEAPSCVPAEVLALIGIDVARSFSSLPRPRAGQWGWTPQEGEEEEWQRSQSASLMRILAAFEWRAMSRLTEADDASVDSAIPAAYVQNCSLLGAMCLGFAKGSEEEAFWLLLHVLDDILGERFLARSPPLLGYHGDCKAATVLVSKMAPHLARAAGPLRLAEFMACLSSRCLLSGFVGFLPDGPLLALWEELLDGHNNCPMFPRFPLLAWLAGLVRHVESSLVAVARRTPPEELVPILFKATQRSALALGDSWRPALHAGTTALLLEARCVSDRAAQMHLAHHEDGGLGPPGSSFAEKDTE